MQECRIWHKAVIKRVSVSSRTDRIVQGRWMHNISVSAGVSVSSRTDRIVQDTLCTYIPYGMYVSVSSRTDRIVQEDLLVRATQIAQRFSILKNGSNSARQSQSMKLGLIARFSILKNGSNSARARRLTSPHVR